MTLHKNPKSLGFTRGWGEVSEKNDIRLAFYRRYTAARGRCNNRNAPDYAYYGGKGIQFRWLSFEMFHADLYKSFIAHAKKHGIQNTTLDRIDSKSDYCQENCRWATRKQQSVSARGRMFTYRGVTLSLSDWAKRSGVTAQTIGRRLDWYGWSFSKALSTPAYKK